MEASEARKRWLENLALQQWLLEAGGAIEERRIAGDSLSDVERLVRAAWVFDMEVANGGVSQYFCNNDLDGWLKFKEQLQLYPLPEFQSFMGVVDRAISNAEDPYDAVLDHDERLGKLYDQVQRSLYEHLISLHLV